MKSNIPSCVIGVLSLFLFILGAKELIEWLSICLLILGGAGLSVSAALFAHVDMYNRDLFYSYHRELSRALNAIEDQEQTNKHTEREIKRIDRQKIRCGSRPSREYQHMLEERSSKNG